jgi:pyruvate/2-oxoacid:ferredoxin oxidoreductase beta subunit
VTHSPRDLTRQPGLLHDAALREAEAYKGPSLVIAYSHRIAYGIEMRNGIEMAMQGADRFPPGAQRSD